VATLNTQNSRYIQPVTVTRHNKKEMVFIVRTRISTNQCSFHLEHAVVLQGTGLGKAIHVHA
jgi:hypothetical protein